MTRKQYQPTERQIEKWNALKPAAMPTDEEFKATWKRQHHNVERGWGMGKRDWVIAHSDDHLTQTYDYNFGMWQGRVDAANGLEPETVDRETSYGYGYTIGFANFERFWHGYDAQARAKFAEQYINN